MTKKLSWDDFKLDYPDENDNSKLGSKDDNDSGKDESGKSGGSSGTPLPGWIIEERVRFSNWRYIPEKEIIINIKIQKQVELRKMNSSFLILNFIKSLSIRPELELDNFIIELEKVSFLKYKKSLADMIEDHFESVILWDINKENEVRSLNFRNSSKFSKKK